MHPTRIGAAWIQFQRPPKVLLRLVPRPLMPEDVEGKHSMCLREVRIQCKRLLRRMLCLWQDFVRRALERERKHAIGMGQPNLRNRVGGISFDGSSKKGQTELYSRCRHPEEMKAPF